ncbi:MAG: hypothetical protein JNL96_28815 [Planctomycetaceae bacterium]|nr:hypothetical protein [Planctomycetaceae bacterium]
MAHGMLLVVHGEVFTRKEGARDGKAYRRAEFQSPGGFFSVNFDKADEFAACPAEGQPVVLTFAVGAIESADFGKKTLSALKFLRAEAPRQVGADPARRQAA